MTADSFVYILSVAYVNVTNVTVTNGNVMAQKKNLITDTDLLLFYFHGTIAMLFVNIKRICWRWKCYCDLPI